MEHGMSTRDWIRFLSLRLMAIVVVAALVTAFQALIGYMEAPVAPGLSRPSLWPVLWPEERGLFTLQFHIPSQDLTAGIEVSLMLALGSVLLAALPAIPLGIWAAIHAKRWFAHAAPATTLFLQGVPTFVAAVWLQTYVAQTWRLLPSAGWTSPASAVLPTVALAVGNVAYLTKFMQAGMAEALRHDSVLGPRARGLSPARIVVRHAFRPALLSTVTFFGTQTAYLINNTLVISAVFQIPGLAAALGSVMYNPPPTPQNPAPIQGQLAGIANPFGTSGHVPVVFFLFALITMLFNLIVDVSYRFLDPRARPTI